MLAVIINPRSGKKHLKRQRHYLMLLLEEHCSAFTTRDTEYKGHATEIARDFVESGCDTKRSGKISSSASFRAEQATISDVSGD